jgi:hypothetical protein
MKPAHVKTGRPAKTAKGRFRYTWQATEATRYLMAALAVMRSRGSYDGRPEFDEACRRLGRYICECCGDNPAGFMSDVADELKEKLMHSPADRNYHVAWLHCAADNLTNGLKRYPTFREWKNKLPDNGSLPADSSLRRSMTRLGLELSPSSKKS